MAVIRSIGRNAAVALAMSSVLAGCSSVEHDSKLASAQTPAPTGTPGQPGPAGSQPPAQYSSALPVTQPPGSPAGDTASATPADAGQPTVEIAKSGRLPVPVPPAADTASVQTLAMASPTMPPVVPFKPQPIAAAVQPPVVASAQPLTQSQPVAQSGGQGRADAAAPFGSSAQKTAGATAQAASAPNGAAAQTSAASQPAATASAASPAQLAFFPPTPAAPGAAPAANAVSPKSGRIASPAATPAVASASTAAAAVQTVALDAGERTFDAPQTVVPTPRPSVATLAYAAQPKTVAALSAMDQKLDFPPAPGEPIPPTASEATPELVKLIKRYAGLYGVPESLVHRVVHRESKYDPNAYHKNGYWGLMQIKYSTAKSMGYQGPPEGLLDPETNLKYAIKYLRGAWLVADNKNDSAIKLYARGYYNDAKRKDMLQVLDK